MTCWSHPYSPLDPSLPPPPSPPRPHRAPPRRLRDPPLCLPLGATGQAIHLYACPVCASILCRAHAPNHATLRPGHEIALDVDRAELFCAAYCDQVYDPDFNAAVVIAYTSLSSSSHPPPVEKRMKRWRVEYRP